MEGIKKRLLIIPHKTEEKIMSGMFTNREIREINRRLAEYFRH